ncbi:hypothetical protein [Streptomyces sp. NPDC056730]|uniref:hypothetical protein n=1 Tax=unclassified Streptomyces TaxID=2593676 RepID=UPI0036B10275
MTVRTAASSRIRTARCPTRVDGFDRLVGDVHSPTRPQSVCIDLPHPLAEAQR